MYTQCELHEIKDNIDEVCIIRYRCDHHTITATTTAAITVVSTAVPATAAIATITAATTGALATAANTTLSSSLSPNDQPGY